MKNLILITTLFLVNITFAQVNLNAESFKQKMTEKNRMIVLTDISYFEPDDAQSLVRLLLYSNQIDIEGLIASTNEVRRNQILPEIIEKTIEAYGKVQPNLLKHEAGFPTAKSLLPLIKKGLPLYGMEGVGKGKDSEGSEWILKMLEKKYMIY